MCNYNVNERDISIVGLYAGPLPETRKYLNYTYAWAQVAYSGRLMNFYQISQMGHQFWYPGGILGLDCMDSNTHGVHGWPYYSNVSDMIRNAFAAITILIEKGQIEETSLDYCPYNYNEGLWFMKNKAKRIPVLVDIASHASHENAMAVYRSYKRQQEINATKFYQQISRRVAEVSKIRKVVRRFPDTDMHIVEVDKKLEIVGHMFVERKVRVRIAEGRRPEDITKDECLAALKQWSDQHHQRIEKRKAEHSVSDV